MISHTRNFSIDSYNWPAPPSIHRGLEWPQCLKCSLIVAKFSNFLNFNVLYCNIKYYSVPKQYSGVYWPAPPTIHRGVEWSQFLNCSLFVCLFVRKFSNFSSPHPPLLYYCLLCYWPALPTIHRGLEWPQCLNCSLFFVCRQIF